MTFVPPGPAWLTTIVYLSGVYFTIRTLFPAVNVGYRLCRGWVRGAWKWVREGGEAVEGEGIFYRAGVDDDDDHGGGIGGDASGIGGGGNGGRRNGRGAEAEGIYGLEHVALNWTWERGLRTMWMNMGYWKDTDEFPDACEALLRYCLEFAGLIPTPISTPSDSSSQKSNTPPISEDVDSVPTLEQKSHVTHPATQRRLNIDILDLGFGCGDQTLYLTQKLPRVTNNLVMVGSYVGVTISRQQYEFARRRVFEGESVIEILLSRDSKFQNTSTGNQQPPLQPSQPSSTPKPRKHPRPTPFTSLHRPTEIHLFNADASNPTRWPSGLHLSLLPALSPPMSPFTLPTSNPNTSTTSTSTIPIPIPLNRQALLNTTHTTHEQWTLALDSLYHFTPSRLPILKYIHTSLHSHLLAFDIFKPSPTRSSSTSTSPITTISSLLQSLFLRLFALVAGIPYRNLLTVEEYIDLLVNDVGYDRRDVKVLDISEMVFPGMSGFVERRSREMEAVGVGWRWWKGFRGVGWVVGKGIVRGGVVVARWRETTEGGLKVEDGMGVGEVRRRR